MKIRVSSLYFEEDNTYKPFAGHLIDIDVIDFENINDVIEKIGENTILYEMSDNVILDYVVENGILSDLGFKDLMKGQPDIISEIVDHFGDSNILNHIDDDAILARAREINIDKVL